jgi:hypothetical protein
MLPLKPGPYWWVVSLYELNEMLDVWYCTPEMNVATDNHQHPTDEWNGILNIPTDVSFHSNGTVVNK